MFLNTKELKGITGITISCLGLKQYMAITSSISITTILYLKKLPCFLVSSSQFDPSNDYMYVYATIDENNNGHQDETEDVPVFWIDLKAPNKGFRL